MQLSAKVEPRPGDPAITPALIAEHGLTPDEYQRLVDMLGREPTFTELGIVSALWSEHCSYKHSRPLLDRKSTRLNSSHSSISYAVFCLKKKKKQKTKQQTKKTPAQYQNRHIPFPN